MNKDILIAPSILAADFSDLKNELKRIEDAGADWVHIDVMDGHFVPNLTIGAVVVKDLRKHTRLILDSHLMIENPQNHIDDFSKAGSDFITFHIEAVKSPRDIIKAIKAKNIKAGVSIKPKTPLSALDNVLDIVDMVLIMSVEPGFGGQSFISGVLPKVKELKKKFNGLIQIDGGINNENAKHAIKAGADVLVAGTYIFKSKDIKEAIKSLKG